MNKLIIKVALGLTLSTAVITGCSVEKTQEGEAPSVDVDPGELPEYDVDTAEVHVGTEKKTVEVPDVDVDVKTEEKTVEVPDVDVDMPGEN